MFSKKKKRELSVLLIQGSLNDFSLTAVVLDAAEHRLKQKKIQTDILDLYALDIDFYNERPREQYNADTQTAYEKILRADGYIFSMPVYSYTMSGALKNLIDLSSDAMTGKYAGILCTSNGPKSYLASLDLMRVLSAEAHVTTVQPVVHAYPESFKNKAIYDETIYDVMDEMIATLLKFMSGGRI